jgi:hypothetical protein
MRLAVFFLSLAFQMLSGILAARGQGIGPFDASRTVMPISAVRLDFGVAKAADVNFGSGFCLDVRCRFVATNYHVAVKSGVSLRIKGEKVIERFLDTGPDDDGATFNELETAGAEPLKYNATRDLAIYVLKEPLAKRRMYGLTLSLDELEENQEVDIYAYPLTSQLKLKRQLIKFPGKFEGTTSDGRLVFRYELFRGSEEIKGGASGGLVVEHNTQEVVGVLSGVSKGSNEAIAISTQALADFVGRVKPELRNELFPPAKPIQDAPTKELLADIYPAYAPPGSTSVIRHGRQEEPEDVANLRGSAQKLTEDIKDFVAVQTILYGGMRRPPPPFQYETQVIGGVQQFREYPEGTKELMEIPWPGVYPVLRPSWEWSSLPSLVGAELKLKIVEAPELEIGSRSLKVFQYYGSVEDGVCVFAKIDDYVLFREAKKYSVPCSGEVWTDKDFNIIRMSENYSLPPEAGWSNYRAVVTYGWLRKPGEPDRLVPTTFAAQAELNGKVYWNRGQFTDYRVFSTKAKLLLQ